MKLDTVIHISDRRKRMVIGYCAPYENYPRTATDGGWDANTAFFFSGMGLCLPYRMAQTLDLAAAGAGEHPFKAHTPVYYAHELTEPPLGRIEQLEITPHGIVIEARLTDAAFTRYLPDFEAMRLGWSLGGSYYPRRDGSHAWWQVDEVSFGYTPRVQFTPDTIRAQEQQTTAALLRAQRGLYVGVR